MNCTHLFVSILILVKNRFHATIMTRLKRGDEKELYYDDNGNPLKVQDLVDASVVHYLVVAHVDEATATNDTITTSNEQCSVVLTSTASSFSSSSSSLHTPMALDTRLLETAPMGHQSMEDSDGCLCIATQLLESPRISIDSIELCDFDNGPDGINTPANAIPLDIDLHGLRDWMRDDDDDEDYDDYCDIDVDCIEMNGFDVVGMDVESQDKKDYDHQESKKSSICSTFAHSLGNFCNNGMMNLDSYSADDHGESNWLSSCSSHFNHSKSGGNNYNHPESEGDSICSYGLSSLRSSIPRLS